MQKKLSGGGAGVVAPSLLCQIIISQTRRIIKWPLVCLREARFCGESVSSALEAPKTSGSEHDSCNEEVEHGQDKKQNKNTAVYRRTTMKA